MAFSVALTQSTTVIGGNKVVFNKILYDENCDYNRSTGEFIAAANGVYEFNFHLTGHPGGTIWFELWMNDRYVLDIVGFCRHFYFVLLAVYRKTPKYETVSYSFEFSYTISNR